MALKLFRRVCRFTLYRTKLTPDEERFFVPLPEGIVVENLRMQFEIEKSLKKDPNTCDLKISNLSPATRAELIHPGIVATVEAGYDDVFRPLFHGDVTWSRSFQDKTEWTTELQVGDGTRAFAHARTNHSFNAGAKVSTVLRAAARAMGMDLPANLVISKDLEAQFASGYAFSGKASDELTRLLSPFGYTWSIQSGKLQILRAEDSLVGLVPIISEQTGMIGSPEMGKPSKTSKKPPVTVKMFLYPELTPGMQIQLDSRALDSKSLTGLYKIEKLKHSGDTHGADWQTEIEVTQVR